MNRYDIGISTTSSTRTEWEKKMAFLFKNLHLIQQIFSNRFRKESVDRTLVICMKFITVPEGSVSDSCTIVVFSFEYVMKKHSFSPEREQEVALLPSSIYLTVVPSATSQTRINFFLKQTCVVVFNVWKLKGGHPKVPCCSS